MTRVAELAGLSVLTVSRGARELDEQPDPYGRHRRTGGGPKRAVDAQPGLLGALDRLVDPDTRGDPQSPLRWTTKSTRHLAQALGAQGFQVADDTVGRLLKQQRYRLQRTRKTLGGAGAPGSGRAVWLLEPAGPPAPGRRLAGRLGRYQEQETHAFY